jgi:RNA polymerase sigma-B factor
MLSPAADSPAVKVLDDRRKLRTTTEGWNDAARFAEYRATGSAAVRALLIEIHMPLAYKLAAQYRNRVLALEDLEQSALEALVLAVDRFDPDRGVPFTSFASVTILGVLRRSFRDSGWGVKVERSTKDLASRLSTAREEVRISLGRSPSIDELAVFLGATRDEVLLAITAKQANRLRSLDELVGDPQILPRRAGHADPVDHGHEVDRRVDLERALAALPASEREVVLLRLEGRTQSDIAALTGRSQMQVSRFLRAATVKLTQRP